MGTLSRLLVSVSVGLAGALVPLAPLHGQGLRTIGGFAGRTDSWQSWPDHPEARHKAGLEVGAFLDADAPPSWLSILAEVAYTQRGARLPLTLNGDVMGDVRADYIVGSVMPKVGFSVGPLSLYAYGGPGLGINVRTRTAQELSIAYQDYKAEVLTAQAGAGVALRIAGRWSVRAEMRRSADLTPAYSKAPGEIRFRSQEIILRIGVRPRLPLP